MAGKKRCGTKVSVNVLEALRHNTVDAVLTQGMQ